MNDERIKVIFLDIDGVLNSTKTFKRIHEEYKKTGKRLSCIEDEYLDNLREIVNKTNAVVVLSSTWRHDFNFIHGELVPCEDIEDVIELYNGLCLRGIKLYDKTDTFPNEDNTYHSWREREIEEWLKEHQNVESFVVIDDEKFDLSTYEKMNRLIYTRKNGEVTGLTYDYVKKAIDILNEPIKKEISNDCSDIILVAIYILTFIFCILCSITLINSSTKIPALDSILLILLLIIIRYLIQK